MQLLHPHCPTKLENLPTWSNIEASFALSYVHWAKKEKSYEEKTINTKEVF